MNINEFKEGDIITRNAPIQYEHNGSRDSSWCGDRFIFKGVDVTSKIIFLEHGDSHFNGEPYKMSYARDPWDEGWCFFPENMWKKMLNKIKIHFNGKK